MANISIFPSKAPISQAVILLGVLRLLKRPGYGRMINALRHVVSLDGKWPVVRRYFMIECAPPKAAELVQLPARTGELLKGVANIPNYTLAELGVRMLVAWEICMWFYVGEMVGRMNVRGYRSRIAYFDKEVEMFNRVGGSYEKAMANL